MDGGYFSHIKPFRCGEQDSQKTLNELIEREELNRGNELPLIST